MFDDTSESPLFESNEASNTVIQSFSVDTSKEVKYVRMRVYNGDNYEGLQLFDKDNDLIADLQWDSSPG